MLSCGKSRGLRGRHNAGYPKGMPRLSQKFRNIAFFLYGKNPKTGELTQPLGSGALLAVPITGNWLLGHTYAVTCHHCILRGATIIRINTSDGKSRLIETEPHEWEFLPDGSDIAAIDLTGLLKPRGGDEIYVLPTTQFATKEFMRETEFEIGEDGFLLGLFSEQPGKNRNMVAARFGNVSLLANDEEPLKQPNGNRRPSHLFDMHSRPGFSGSPVFAYRTPYGDLRTAQLRGIDKRSSRRTTLDVISRREAAFYASEIDYRTQGDQSFFSMREHDEDRRESLEAEKNTFLVLFGIHVGQYYDRVTAKKAKSVHAEWGEPVIDGDELEIPNSVALVVPAWDVHELLMLNKFAEQRKARERRDNENRLNAAKPDKHHG